MLTQLTQLGILRSAHPVRWRYAVAEIRAFHQMTLEEGKGGAKWSEAQLKTGLQACQAIEADPTGATCWRADCAACCC